MSDMSAGFALLPKGRYRGAARAVRAYAKAIRQDSRHAFPMLVVPNLLAGLASGLFVYATRAFIDAVSAGRGFIPAIMPIVIYTALRLVVDSLKHYGDILYERAGFNATAAMQQDVIGHYSRLYTGYFDDADRYDTAFRALRFAANDVHGMVRRMALFFGSALSIISLVAAISTVEWWLGLVMLASAVLVSVLQSRLDNAKYQNDREKAKLRRRAAYYSEELRRKENQSEFKLYGCAEFFAARYQLFSNAAAALQMRFGKKHIGTKLAKALLGALTELFFYAYGALRVAAGTYTMGAFSVLLTGFSSLSTSLYGLMFFFQYVNPPALEAQNWAEFMDERELLMTLPESPMPLVKIQSIQFRDVYFRYAGREDYALDGVSFTIDAPGTVSVVGENGAGKTTLVRLLMGLYKPERGEILINGRPYNEYAYTDIWARMSTVFQTYRAYPFTVKENVTLAEGEAADAPVWRALERTGLKKKLERFPGGLQTPMTRLFSDEGMQLSGGETQKLAIARALYRNADVLILDEPSSALDPRAESELLDTVAAEGRERLVIFISHRMSSAKASDTVLYMEHGKLIGAGTHTELMESAEGYRALFNAQAEMYKRKENEE